MEQVVLLWWLECQWLKTHVPIASPTSPGSMGGMGEGRGVKLGWKVQPHGLMASHPLTCTHTTQPTAGSTEANLGAVWVGSRHRHCLSVGRWGSQYQEREEVIVYLLAKLLCTTAPLERSPVTMVENHHSRLINPTDLTITVVELCPYQLK